MYVAALGSALRFDVERASYADHITITQVIGLAGGGSALQRVSPDSPANPLFPQACFAGNPFVKGTGPMTTCSGCGRVSTW